MTPKSGASSPLTTFPTSTQKGRLQGISLSLKTMGKGIVSTIFTGFSVGMLLGGIVSGFIAAQFIIAEEQRKAYIRKYLPWYNENNHFKHSVFI